MVVSNKKLKKAAESEEKSMWWRILLILVLVFLFSFFSSLGGTGDEKSQRYILSAIFQGLAAIFALVLTGILVGSQLIANKYTHRAIDCFLKTWSVLSLIFLYPIAMLYLLISLNQISEGNPLDNTRMALTISATISLIVFSGIIIYLILFTLKPKRIFNVLEGCAKKDRNSEEILEIFSEIIIKAINNDEIETTNEGIRKITDIYKDAIFIKEDEEVASKYSLKLERYIKVARRAENGEVLVEIVKNINKIMMEGHKRGKNRWIPQHFSRIVKNILVYSKNKDDGTFTVCVGDIRNSALEAKDMKRKVTGTSYYLKHLLFPLCNIEEVLSKEADSPERVSQLNFVTANLYEIGKEYAESGKKELKDGIIQIVWALKDNLKYSCINKIHFDEFKMNIWSTFDIIKKSMKNKMGEAVETMLMGMIRLVDETSKDEKLHLYLNEILEPLVLLCAGFKVGGEKERLDTLLNTIDTTIRDEGQRKLIKSYISAYLEQGVFKSELEKMTHSEKEMNAYVEAVKYILDELEKRWGV